MYPYQRTPMGNPHKKKPFLSGYLWVKIPQECLENTINTMGTLLGVHPSLALEFEAGQKKHPSFSETFQPLGIGLQLPGH